MPPIVRGEDPDLMAILRISDAQGRVWVVAGVLARIAVQEGHTERQARTLDVARDGVIVEAKVVVP